MLSTLLCLLNLTPAAHAWLPPTFHVVKMIAKKHEKIEEARFRSKISIYKNNGELSRTYTETMILTDPEHVSVRLTDETGAEIASHTRKLMSTRSGAIDRPIAYDLLIVRDYSSIFEHFKSQGIPLKTESELYSQKEGSLPYKLEDSVAFARYENRFAVVLGEDAKSASMEARSPQVWVEKESYLPLRAVLPSGSFPMDLRFSGYQVYGYQSAKNFLYPRVMQIYRSGELWAKVEVQDVKVGASGSLEPVRNKSDLDGDARDFVEAYFRWVR